MGYFSREIFILRYWRQDQWNLRLSAHRRNHDSTLDWMLWESERVFNSRVFCYTKCRVCSQCNEITKEERGTKIIQHLNSTYTWYKLFQEKSRAHKISVKFFSCKSWIYQYLNYNRKFLSMIYLFTVMKRWKSRKKIKQKNNNNSYRETQITPQFHWVEKKVILCIFKK